MIICRCRTCVGSGQWAHSRMGGMGGASVAFCGGRNEEVAFCSTAPSLSAEPNPWGRTRAPPKTPQRSPVRSLLRAWDANHPTRCALAETFYAFFFLLFVLSGLRRKRKKNTDQETRALLGSGRIDRSHCHPRLPGEKDSQISKNDVSVDSAGF